MSRKLLIIEDNRELAELLTLHLHDLSYSVDVEYDGLAGVKRTEQTDYDLVVLDLMLPGIDGLEVCRRLRSQPQFVPILMLTSKSSELDRVLGLEMGADDYVTKPFSIQEVLARIKAIFRRMDAVKNQQSERTNTPRILQLKELAIDIEKRKVLIKEREIDLTAKEFDLLLYFARHPGRVFSRSQLLDHVWGYGHDSYEHTVNSHINRLRVKIEDDPGNPRYVLTVWGVGYKFADKLCD